ncbi:ABC transporter ATP-binding protein [Saccharopolyspora phatthalungensis]|uniref:Peptide/nickel transport system ATP-binding protein n=1 Tax=Saccharopolyspora phatthalungensis TaxID=664693 RepID=A0A840Q2R4_9PSEU|nr:ABC transporter ATP-binding protein [Saccharopolyspora phatthalungensis]MBB5152655.1 peptide/nickel transport system ATP-binding protein [Saccharopolyspora phatthalungensis]
MSPILQLRDVSVAYRGAEDASVRGVSLSLGEGETLGLAGESGCGKTTLAMSVLRLLPKSARIGGEILLDGKDVREMSFGQLRAARWASASVVFQGAMHALNPVRTIGDQIAEPIKLHGQANGDLRERVAELLAQVELPADRADAYPHELSGGQKQRVMIAMALACEPRLVIADEPTTALDVVVQAQILELMGRLVAERGIALMMISHDLSVLSASCARLAVMYQGQVVEHGPSQQVMTHPRHAHSQALASAFPTVGDPRFRLTAGASSGSALLSAQDVSVDFTSRSGQAVRAVRGVDLEVGENEIVALVGQSGSGKTTLARTLLGLQRPTGGAVRFDGVPLPTGSAGLREYRKQVQLVLQDPTGALNPRHTVYEAVAEGLRIHGITDDEQGRVAAALEAAELRPAEKFFGRLPQELSGGQRQRVVIAGALVLEPRVLVADEPVASLDATVRGEILALLLRLRVERGLSTLVITHDLGLAWNIADRVAVMYRGELVEVGAVEQVLLAPQHDYTQNLLAAVPAVERRVA